MALYILCLILEFGIFNISSLDLTSTWWNLVVEKYSTCVNGKYKLYVDVELFRPMRGSKIYTYNSSYHDIIGKRFCSIVTYFVLTKVMLKNDCIEFLLNIYFQVVVQLSPLTRDGFHANNFTLSENMIKNLLI